MIEYSSKKNITIEDARIIWRNFSGEKKKYNDEGDRNFCVVISNHDDAEMLRAEGWNVKKYQRSEDDEVLEYLFVNVLFGRIPPAIHRKKGKKMTLMTEDSIELLDRDEIENVDIVIRPYEYDVNGNTGISAYVKTMYVRVADDPFAHKYEEEDEEAPFL